jgi:hypothetical protein
MRKRQNSFLYPITRDWGFEGQKRKITPNHEISPSSGRKRKYRRMAEDNQSDPQHVSLCLVKGWTRYEETLLHERRPCTAGYRLQRERERETFATKDALGAETTGTFTHTHTHTHTHICTHTHLSQVPGRRSIITQS